MKTKEQLRSAFLQYIEKAAAKLENEIRLTRKDLDLCVQEGKITKAKYNQEMDYIESLETALHKLQQTIKTT